MSSVSNDIHKELLVYHDLVKVTCDVKLLFTQGFITPEETQTQMQTRILIQIQIRHSILLRSPTHQQKYFGVNTIYKYTAHTHNAHSGLLCTTHARTPRGPHAYTHG